jgi:hypothetical protein
MPFIILLLFFSNFHIEVLVGGLEDVVNLLNAVGAQKELNLQK